MRAGNDSRKVRSSQAGIHPRLDGLLRRYRESEWSQPLHPPSCRAFEALRPLVEAAHRPLVLDAGCGTGESTRRLAERFPDHLVIGVDKSGARLGKLHASQFPWRDKNAVWLRADLTTFWRLARRAGWTLDFHFLLYPNPWPKPGQLQRRWHAHPVFPELLALGGRLEMRCNWNIYADEFAFAVSRFLGRPIEAASLAVDAPLSPFERKYHDSGHDLYCVVSRSSGV
jgi:tRNA G46 methylase TrmB